MFTFVSRTVLDIPVTWDRTFFETTRVKYRRARKLIEFSINVQFEKQLRKVHFKNLNTEQNLTKINESLLKYEKKTHIFDNLTEIASQSLPLHFNKRIENIRTIIQEHCNAIENILYQENEYWKDIHCAIDQNLITVNDIYPCRNNIPTINNEQNSSELINDNSSTSIEINLSSLTENLIPTKQEHLNIIVPSIESNQTVPSINTTYVIKIEETPDKSCSHISSIENEVSPMYSQPNFPAPLYFSPTFLQDEQSQSNRNILVPIDQNQTTLVKPRIIIHRIRRTLLLDYLKTEENTNIHIRSKFTDDSIQNESNSIHIIKNTKQSRKRKQSTSEDDSIKPNTVTLRKRKSVSIIGIKETKPEKKIIKQRKNKKTKKNKIPIRDPSPLPIIDRSKHYNTRFSTRSHRLNNFTLSIINIESDDENNESKSHFQLRKKSTKQEKRVKSIKNKKH